MRKYYKVNLYSTPVGFVSCTNEEVKHAELKESDVTKVIGSVYVYKDENNNYKEKFTDHDIPVYIPDDKNRFYFPMSTDYMQVMEEVSKYGFSLHIRSTDLTKQNKKAIKTIPSIEIIKENYPYFEWEALTQTTKTIEKAEEDKKLFIKSTKERFMGIKSN